MNIFKKAALIATIAMSFNAFAQSDGDSSSLGGLSMGMLDMSVEQSIDKESLLGKDSMPWTVGRWSSCTATCDRTGGGAYTATGNQYRTVSCNDPSGSCSGKKPYSSKSCSTSCTKQK